MHRDAKEGDFCFVFSKDEFRRPSQWRFGALFRVRSQVWHPLTGFKNQLELVNRPEVSVPIEEKLFHNMEVEGAVLELKVEILDQIAQAIGAFAGHEQSEIFQSFRMAR